MGSTNFGTQTLRFDFKQPATGLGFNQIHYKTIPAGIYEGGLISKINDTSVNVAALECYIYDDANDLGIKISTATTAAISVSTVNIYVVLRFDWVDSENNYMDILAIPFASIQADDLVVGRCVFDGSTLQTTFDYTRRDDASLQTLEDRRDDFKVVPTEPISNQVTVQGGTLISADGEITVATANTSAITDTTLGRIDLVYLDKTGAIQVLEGVDSGSPVEPDFPAGFVVARIDRGASKTIINGTEIEQIYDPYAFYNQGASTVSITNQNEFFSATEVESALNELADYHNIRGETTELLATGQTINKGELVLKINGELGTGSSYALKKSSNVVGLDNFGLGDAGDAMGFGNAQTLSSGVFCGFWSNIDNSPLAYDNSTYVFKRTPITGGDTITYSNTLVVRSSLSTSIIGCVKLTSTTYLCMYDKTNGGSGTIYGRSITFDGSSTISYTDVEFATPLTHRSGTIPTGRIQLFYLADNHFLFVREGASQTIEATICRYNTGTNDMTQLQTWITISVAQGNFNGFNGAKIDTSTGEVLILGVSTIKPYVSYFTYNTSTYAITVLMDEGPPTYPNSLVRLLSLSNNNSFTDLKGVGMEANGIVASEQFVGSFHIKRDTIFDPSSPYGPLWSWIKHPLNHLVYPNITNNVPSVQSWVTTPNHNLGFIHMLLETASYTNGYRTGFFWVDPEGNVKWLSLEREFTTVTNTIVMAKYTSQEYDSSVNEMFVTEFDQITNEEWLILFYQIPEVIGLAAETQTAGNTIKYIKKGKLTGLSGLTVGATYGINLLTGDLEIDGVIPVGKALSATVLEVDTTGITGE